MRKGWTLGNQADGIPAPDLGIKQVDCAGVIEDWLRLHASPQPEGIVVARVNRIGASLDGLPCAQQNQQQGTVTAITSNTSTPEPSERRDTPASGD
jgi:hypothetical protein